MEYILTSFHRGKNRRAIGESSLCMSLHREAAERATIVYKHAMKRFKRNRMLCKIFTYIIRHLVTTSACCVNF